MVFKSRKQNLYVGTTGYFQSYALTSDLGLTYENNVSLSSSCIYVPTMLL